MIAGGDFGISNNHENENFMLFDGRIMAFPLLLQCFNHNINITNSKQIKTE